MRFTPVLARPDASRMQIGDGMKPWLPRFTVWLGLLTSIGLLFFISFDAWAQDGTGHDVETRQDRAQVVVPAQALPAKQMLSVLFVGNDPTQEFMPPSYETGLAAERYPELMRERTPAFEALLKEHFETVKVVFGPEYKAAMSDDYDVTVFDVLPPSIGEVAGVSWKKQRLPNDFTHASVMIGDVAPKTLGRFGWGLRLDHL